MATEPRTHWQDCWRSHHDCAIVAVEHLAEGAEVLMFDALADADENANALEMKHRLWLRGFLGEDDDVAELADGKPADG